jgi:pimeloyl-ACP methyl ester carboxylesterase
MIDNSYYSQEVHGPYELHDIGNLDLEEGGTVRGCKLAYATFGTLNAAKDNAILIPTWYSGTNKIIEQVYIGQGRALDPDKYFIIIVNQIGGGLSTSPHNTPAPAGMGNFPHVRIGDDVRAQHKLVTEKFGLQSLALVVGGSMGAQQTYEWAVRYPDMVKRAAPIAGTARNNDPRFPVHRNSGRGDHVRPCFQQGLLHILGGGAGGSAAPCQNLGGDGLEHRVLPGKSAQVTGLFIPRRFHHQLHVWLFQRHGSERSHLHGVEMATRRRQPPHRRGLAGRVGSN